MSGGPERETLASRSQLVIGFQPGDQVAIGGLIHGIDIEAQVLITPEGQRVALGDGAVEVAPGLHAHAVANPRLGPLAVAFWGRGDVPIVRRRGVRRRSLDRLAGRGCFKGDCNFSIAIGAGADPAPPRGAAGLPFPGRVYGRWPWTPPAFARLRTPISRRIGLAGVPPRAVRLMTSSSTSTSRTRYPSRNRRSR